MIDAKVTKCRGAATVLGRRPAENQGLASDMALVLMGDERVVTQ
jgi:hypothetical protein